MQKEVKSQCVRFVAKHPVTIVVLRSKPQIAYRCWQCGNEIYEGEDLYIINDEMWCECGRCTTAEIDGLDYDYD